MKRILYILLFLLFPANTFGQTAVITLIDSMSLDSIWISLLNTKTGEIQRVVLTQASTLFGLDTIGTSDVLVETGGTDTVAHALNDTLFIINEFSTDDGFLYKHVNEKRTGARATRRLELRMIGKEGIKHIEFKYVGVNSNGIYENGYTGDGKPESRGKATTFIGTQGTILLLF